MILMVLLNITNLVCLRIVILSLLSRVVNIILCNGNCDTNNIYDPKYTSSELHYLPVHLLLQLCCLQVLTMWLPKVKCEALTPQKFFNESNQS